MTERIFDESSYGGDEKPDVICMLNMLDLRDTLNAIQSVLSAILLIMIFDTLSQI